MSTIMRRVPTWEQQDELQRRLVILNDWDGETTPEGMAAAVAVREFAGEAASRVLSVTQVVRRNAAQSDVADVADSA